VVATPAAVPAKTAFAVSLIKSGLKSSGDWRGGGGAIVTTESIGQFSKKCQDDKWTSLLGLINGTESALAPSVLLLVMQERPVAWGKNL
jgi:hypothetical protein